MCGVFGEVFLCDVKNVYSIAKATDLTTCVVFVIGRIALNVILFLCPYSNQDMLTLVYMYTCLANTEPSYLTSQF